MKTEFLQKVQSLPSSEAKDSLLMLISIGPDGEEFFEFVGDNILDYGSECAEIWDNFCDEYKSARR